MDAKTLMKRLNLLSLLALFWLIPTCNRNAVPTPIAGDFVPGEHQAFFIDVAEEGGVWLAPDTLKALGVDVNTADAPALRLSWNGQTVPTRSVEDEGKWGLFFFAPAFHTRYTQETSFLLELDATGTPIPTQTPAEATMPALPGLTQVTWEENRRYFPQATAEIPWLWQPIYAPGEIAHTLSLTNAVAGPMTVTVRLWSHTRFTPTPDHRLQIYWDEELKGQWEWAGQGMQTLTASWDEATPQGNHTLTLNTPAISDSGIAIVWIDGWDITYPHASVPPNGLLQAQGATLSAGKEGLMVLDVTEGLAPVALGETAPDGNIGVEPGHHYWIGNFEAAAAPVRVRPALSLDVASLADTTYLVIAPTAAHEALEPLLAHRRAEGLVTAMVTPQAIYDTFGAGRAEPVAINALVQSLPALRYLLLAGDAVADPAGYDTEGQQLRVVAPFTRTAVLGETPADGRYSVNVEGFPTVAVGRFPAETVAGIKALVEKTLLWETTEETPTVVLVTDNELRFSDMLDAIIPLISGGEDAERIDSGEERSRERLLEALNRGPTWFNYTGHGSLTRLCDEEILTINDGENWKQPSVVVAWTCLAGHFAHPTQASIAEAWMQTAGGGAVAFLGPVGETTTFEQRPAAQAFYAALPQQRRIGDAWLKAIQTETGAPDVRWGFLVLGDPALDVKPGP